MNILMQPEAASQSLFSTPFKICIVGITSCNYVTVSIYYGSQELYSSFEIPRKEVRDAVYCTIDFSLVKKEYDNVLYVKVDEFVKEFLFDVVMINGQIYKTWKRLEEDFNTIQLLPFFPLKNEDENMLKQIDENNDNLALYSNRFAFNIRTQDLKTLDKGEWACDTVINEYICLCLLKYNTSNMMYVFNTDFYYLLKKYHDVDHWTQGRTATELEVNIFEKDLLFFTVLDNNHFCLIVVNNNGRSMTSFDSLNRSQDIVMGNIWKYLEFEYARVFSDVGGMNEGDWNFYTATGVPRQENWVDCGIYVALFAKFLLASYQNNPQMVKTMLEHNEDFLHLFIDINDARITPMRKRMKLSVIKGEIF